MPKIPPDLLADWNIVVADDEEDSLELARYILDFYGARVHTAINGADGYDVIERERPHFVISDLSMPMVDGWELIRRLKQSPELRDIPVIALTAHAMAGDPARAIAAGFHNYLTKPLTADTFIDQLVGLLIAIPELAGLLRF